MFNPRDLFRWEIFLAPRLIAGCCYALAVAWIVVAGSYGLAMCAMYAAAMPLPALLGAVTILLSVVLGIVLLRIAAEFVLATLRINEQLGGIHATIDHCARLLQVMR